MRTYVAEFTDRLVVKIRPEEKRELQALAEEEGLTVSELVRLALGLEGPVAPLRKHP